MWPPQIQHKGQSTGLIRYWLGRCWLSLLGWNVTGELPQEPKFILVGGPHTSNWDFFIGLPALWVYRIRVVWMGKHSLFVGPMGPIMRALGGIAIDRSAPQGVVQQMAECFQQTGKLVVVIPAKGTRGKREYWKSGFYHIARGADVPIACGYLDYATRTARIGHSFRPTGDVKQDMDGVRAFFAQARGKRAELEDNIRLKEEDNG